MKAPSFLYPMTGILSARWPGLCLFLKITLLFIILLDMSIIWNGRKKKLPESLWQPVSKAEEQALIEGLKAVPRAERHRLREIPEEEAYDQWRLRLAAEAIENAAEQCGGDLCQQILEKNGNREEWELEHWDQ